jgi:mannose-1-phosphate guanylyltransferase
MKAMVLCAGKGTRVQPITFSVPKPMINIINKPILSFILDHLKSQGVDEVVINTSHLSERIENYFGDGFDRNMRISYSFEGALADGKMQSLAIGSAGGMKRIQDRSQFFDDTFVVLCGDAVIDLDIEELVRFHKERGAVATIAALDVPIEEVDKYGIVVTNVDGAVTSFQEKPNPAAALSKLANTGIYVFEPEIFDYIPSNAEYDIGSELFPKLIDLGVPFYAKECHFNWIDVGNVEDFIASSFEVLAGLSPVAQAPGVEVKPGVRIGSNVVVNAALPMIEGPVYIGAGTIIKTGAVIKGPVIIGENCVVEADTYLEGVILGSYSHIRENCRLVDHVVFEDWIIPNDNSAFKISDSRFVYLVADVREQPDCGLASTYSQEEELDGKSCLLSTG